MVTFGCDGLRSFRIRPAVSLTVLSLDANPFLPRSMHQVRGAGQRHDWARTSSSRIGKKASPGPIFYYVYAVLPTLLREKYALNLQREFPRIPFYPTCTWRLGAGAAGLHLLERRTLACRADRHTHPSVPRHASKPILNRRLSGQSLSTRTRQSPAFRARRGTIASGTLAIDWVRPTRKDPARSHLRGSQQLSLRRLQRYYRAGEVDGSARNGW